MFFKDGSTPLHEAARQEDVAKVQALIISGADVGIKDKNGATPLDFATPDGTCRDFLDHHATASPQSMQTNENFLPQHSNTTGRFLNLKIVCHLRGCL